MQFWLARIPCLHRRIIVTLDDRQENSIDGVLFDKRGGWLVLKDARLLQANRPPVPMDGDVVIECAKVSFIQVVPA